MGDRWTEKDLSRSTYVWLPLRVGGNQATLENHEYWSMPSGDNGVSQGIAEVSYLAKDGALRGGAKMLTNAAAGYIGGTGNGAVTFPGIRSRSVQRKTLKIYYFNGDKATRYAMLTVNEAKPLKVAFLSTEGEKGISVASVDLRPGGNNITITGFSGGWGPDIAELKVAE